MERIRWTKKISYRNILEIKKQETKNAGTVMFYYPSKINQKSDNKKQMNEKIKRISRHIDRYSKPKNTDMLGRYLHALVRKELKIHGFKIISEENNAKSYHEKEWNGNID